MKRPAEPVTRAPRPRLVFFQFRYDVRLPRFLLLQKDEHVRCLQQDFDVTVVSEDCDYDVVCATVEPDLALFESGVPNPECRRLSITGTRSHPRVPKLGLLHADAFCHGRGGFLSDMDEWGIDTFFAIATAALDFNRDLEGRLFAWPNAIDPAIYRDYGSAKEIDVLFTGNMGALYPWRRKMLGLLPPVYPAVVQRHNGYGAGAVATKVGESYARLINSARIAPSCGTVAHEVVRKHFEIPACMTCLVTERTPTLEAAGFVDMVNCVFADEHTVLDKLARLFARPEELDAVTRAGHALVHARHTLRQRDQIHQWFVLQRAMRPGLVVDQPTAFAPLRLTAAASARFPAAEDRPQLSLLALGDAARAAGEPAAARALFLACTRLVDYMPEPHVRIALCELQLGHAGRAHAWITRPLEFTLAVYGAAAPDPVEWATYLLCLLCRGRTREAALKGRLFAALDHSALRRVRWLLAVLAALGDTGPPPSGEAMDGDGRTLHRLPVLATAEWIAQAAAMLDACAQAGLARTLRAAAVRAPRVDAPAAMRAVDDVLSLDHLVREMRRRAIRRRLVTRIVDTTRHALHGLERRVGFFLPTRLSALRHEPLFQRLRDAFDDPAVHNALALSARRRGRMPRGFAHAARMSGKRVLPGLHAVMAPTRVRIDLLMVHGSWLRAMPERLRIVADLAVECEYLFVVDCGAVARGRLAGLLGDRFGAAEALRGSGRTDQIVFRRRPASTRLDPQPTPFLEPAT